MKGDKIEPNYIMGIDPYDDKPDYKGFMEHYKEASEKGVPIDMKYLRELASKYNTPVPEFKNGELIWKKHKI